MGTQNIFVAVEPLAGKRHIKVTDQRKKGDYANYIKGLVLSYPDAIELQLVSDQ
jgi:hypothetical protein